MKNYLLALSVAAVLSTAGNAMTFENKTGQTVVFSLTTDESLKPLKVFPVREEDADEHDVFVEANSSKEVSMKGLLQKMQEHACPRHGGNYPLHVAARPEPQGLPHQWTLGRAVVITPQSDLSDIDDMTFIYDGRSCCIKEEK